MNTWKNKKLAQMLHTSGLFTLLEDRALKEMGGQDPLGGLPLWPWGGTD